MEQNAGTEQPEKRWTPQPYHVGAKDGQRFDRVEIVTVNRWKESYLSGDEWRFNAAIKLYRKGAEVYVQTFRNVEEAAQCLPAILLGVAGNINWEKLQEANAGKCDQEGCDQLATHYLYLKERYDREGNKRPAKDHGEYRQFCGRHKARGDWGLDDADLNYEVIPIHSVKS